MTRFFACSLMLALAAPALAADLPGMRGGTGSGNKGKKLGDEMECLVEPHMVANVGSPVEGVIAQIFAARGSEVRQGQPLARLNSNVEGATLNLRRAQQDYGERKVKRNEDLYKKNLIPASEKDELETQTHIAALEVKQQQEVLNQRTINSPLTGVVVERYLSPGEHISQEKIFKIAQIDPLNVEVVVPVELFGSVRVGAIGDIRLDPLFTGGYKAKVTVVDRVIDAASGTFGVRLELPNPGNKIPAGIRCAVKFSR